MSFSHLVRRLAVVLGAMGVLAPAGAGDVRPAGIFRDHMVVQRNAAVPVWGWAEPGEEVSVTLGERTGRATAGADGKWMVRLEPLEAGGPLELLVKGKDEVTIQDVLVGEVWLCSGQSNMAMTVGGCLNAAEEAKSADLPKIRHFRTARTASPVPQADAAGAWAVCSPTTVRGFTGAGFFFGRELHRRLGVPVGLINSSVGGTAIERWTNRRGLKPGASPPPGRDAGDPEVRRAGEEYRQQLAEWQQKVAAEKDRQKRRRMRPPRPPKLLADLYAHCGDLYNGMIHPLVPYAVRGAIWYQGEANARGARALAYRDQLAAMVAGWRAVWGRGDLPFGVVQLPNYRRRLPQPSESSWALMRESQAVVAATVPHVGLAVTIDAGEARNIHPRNKQAVGRRLALWALAKVYGREVAFSGPVYEKRTAENGRLRIHFRHVGGGLVARGGGAVKGFAVAGEDRKWAWAEAAIDGQTVVVSSSDVPRPVAVRYAWADNPECNLYSKDGLPAAPFRTDDWPAVPQPRPRPKSRPRPAERATSSGP